MDNQGRLLTTEAEQEARREEHFSEVLNTSPPPLEVDMQDPEEDVDLNTTPPEKEEIMAAIRSLKNRKAPGQDTRSAELFKADPEFAAQALQPLFAAIHVLEEKQLPEETQIRPCRPVPVLLLRLLIQDLKDSANHLRT